jgi:hypothetical protein
MCPASGIAWAQSKLYLAKILWCFDIEVVPGKDLSFERDFSIYAMWNRPPFRVRFIPIGREQEVS